MSNNKIKKRTATISLLEDGTQGAITRCTRVIKNKKRLRKSHYEMAKAYSERGLAYYKARQFNDAYADFQQACYKVGCEFITTKKTNELLTPKKKDLKKCKSECFQNHILRFANICDELGQHDRAILIIELIAPHSIPAKVTLATLLFNQLRSKQFNENSYNKDNLKRVADLITTTINDLEKDKKEKDKKKRRTELLKRLYKNQGELAVFEGCYSQAISCFDDALKLDPGYLSAYHCKARTLMKQGRYDDAKEVLGDAKKIINNEKLSKNWQDNLNLLSMKELIEQDNALLNQRYNGPTCSIDLEGYPGPTTCVKLCAQSLLHMRIPDEYKKWEKLPENINSDKFKGTIPAGQQYEMAENYWVNVYCYKRTLIIVHQPKKKQSDYELNGKQNSKKFISNWKKYAKPFIDYLTKEYNEYSIVHTGYFEGAVFAEISAFFFGQRALTFQSLGNEHIIKELEENWGNLIAGDYYNLSTYTVDSTIVGRLGGYRGEVFKMKTLSSTHAYEKNHYCYSMSELENIALSCLDGGYQLPIKYDDEQHHPKPWCHAKSCRTKKTSEPLSYISSSKSAYSMDYLLFKKNENQSDIDSTSDEVSDKILHDKQRHMAERINSFLSPDNQSAVPENYPKAYKILEKSVGSPFEPCFHIVRGTPGIGKKTLVRYYLTEHKSHYDEVQLLSCNTIEDLLSSFQFFANKNNIAYQLPLTLSDVIAYINAGLNEKKSFLLVLFDVIDFSGLKELFEKVHSSKYLSCLMTTARNDTPEYINAKITFQYLKPWSIEDGIDLIEKQQSKIKLKSHEEDGEEIKKNITVALGGIPAAIHQVYHYCKSNNINLKEFLKRSETLGIVYLLVSSESQYRDRGFVARTLDLVSHACNLQVGAEYILLFCSILKKTPINSEVLKSLINRVTSEDHIDYKKSVLFLNDMSLVSLNDNKVSVSQLTADIILYHYINNEPTLKINRIIFILLDYLLPKNLIDLQAENINGLIVPGLINSLFLMIQLLLSNINDALALDVKALISRCQSMKISAVLPALISILTDHQQLLEGVGGGVIADWLMLLTELNVAFARLNKKDKKNKRLKMNELSFNFNDMFNSTGLELLDNLVEKLRKLFKQSQRLLITDPESVKGLNSPPVVTRKGISSEPGVAPSNHSSPKFNIIVNNTFNNNGNGAMFAPKKAIIDTMTNIQHQYNNTLQGKNTMTQQLTEMNKRSNDSLLVLLNETSYAWMRHATPGDGDCFFHAVGLDSGDNPLNRQTMIEALLSKSNNDEICQVAALDIKAFLYAAFTYQTMEIKPVDPFHREAEQKVAEQLLKKFPGIAQGFRQKEEEEKKLYQAIVNAKELLGEAQTQGLLHEELLSQLTQQNTLHHSEAAKTLKNSMDAVSQLENELRDLCATQPIFEAYIKHYFGTEENQARGYFPFLRPTRSEAGDNLLRRQLMDIIAEEWGIQICIWVQDSPHWPPQCLNPQVATNNSDNVRHIFYTDGLHFEGVTMSPYVLKASSGKMATTTLSLPQVKLPYQEPYQNIRCLITYLSYLKNDPSNSEEIASIRTNILLPFITTVGFHADSVSTLLALVSLGDEILTKAIIDKAFALLPTKQDTDPSLRYQFLVQILFYHALSTKPILSHETLISLAKQLCERLVELRINFGDSLQKTSVQTMMGLHYAIDLLTQYPGVGVVVHKQLKKAISAQKLDVKTQQRRYPLYYSTIKQSKDNLKKLQRKETVSQTLERQKKGVTELFKAGGAGVAGATSFLSGSGLLAAAIAAAALGMGAPLVILPGAIVAFGSGVILGIKGGVMALNHLYKGYNLLSPLPAAQSFSSRPIMPSATISSQYWALLLTALSDYQLKETLSGEASLPVIGFLTELLLATPTELPEKQLTEIMSYYQHYYDVSHKESVVNRFIVASMQRLSEAGHVLFPKLTATGENKQQLSHDALLAYEHCLLKVDNNIQVYITQYGECLNNRAKKKELKNALKKDKSIGMTLDNLEQRYKKRQQLHTVLTDCLNRQDKGMENSLNTQKSSATLLTANTAIKTAWKKTFGRDKAVFELCEKYESTLAKAQEENQALSLDKGAALYLELERNVLSYIDSKKAQFSSVGKQLALQLKAILIIYKPTPEAKMKEATEAGTQKGSLMQARIFEVKEQITNIKDRINHTKGLGSEAARTQLQVLKNRLFIEEQKIAKNIVIPPMISADHIIVKKVKNIEVEINAIDNALSTLLAENNNSDTSYNNPIIDLDNFTQQKKHQAAHSKEKANIEVASYDINGDDYDISMSYAGGPWLTANGNNNIKKLSEKLNSSCAFYASEAADAVKLRKGFIVCKRFEFDKESYAEKLVDEINKFANKLYNEYIEAQQNNETSSPPKSPTSVGL